MLDRAGIAGPGLSLDEARSHMSLWVALASPLLLGFDIRKPIDPAIKEILTNPEVLAVHKDPLAQQARPVRTQRWAYGKCVDPQQSDPVLALEKSLANNDTALLILNRADGHMRSGNISIDFDDVYGGRYTDPTPPLAYHVRDMWAHKDLGVVTCCATVTLAAHESRFLRLTPAPAKQYTCDTLQFCSLL